MGQAKKEFSEVFDIIIFKLIGNKTLFQVFELLNSKQKSMKEKINKIKKFDILKVNYNEMMFSEYIIQSEIKPINLWQNLK